MKRLFVVALMLGVAACATKYGEMGFAGGVAAEPIMPGVYRIKARGNGYTDSSTVQDFVLLKAAETTLAAGQTHFILSGSSDASRMGAVTTPGTMTVTSYGSTAIGTYNPGVTSTYIKPGMDTIIQTLTVTPPAVAPPGAFDAAAIVATIGPRLKTQ